MPIAGELGRSLHLLASALRCLKQQPKSLHPTPNRFSSISAMETSTSFVPITPSSVKRSIFSILSAAAEYISARLSLAKEEAALAAKDLVQLLVLSATALVATVVAYGLVIAAAVVWSASKWWGGDWVPALLSVACTQVMLALICARQALRRAKLASWFKSTIKEFQEDEEWLRNTRDASKL